MSDQQTEILCDDYENYTEDHKEKSDENYNPYDYVFSMYDQVELVCCEFNWEFVE